MSIIARQTETKLRRPYSPKQSLENRALKPKTRIVSYQHASLLNIGMYYFGAANAVRKGW